MARRVDRFEFSPGEADRVLDAMAEITRAGNGWINLLPGVDPDDAPPAPTGLTAILAPRTPGVVMGTWKPGVPGRRGPQGAQVGLLHSAGRFAARRLASMGAPLPEGWIVRQDNPRRGLIVVARVDAPDSEVLDWIIAAGTAFSAYTPSGYWRADVFLPTPQ
jgi:hypothetical protein